MPKLVTPPTRLTAEVPIIFLAGPIQGANDWQQEAIRMIHNSEPGAYIANPRRPIDFEGEFSQEMYNEQVDWETYHLRKAGKAGVVLFWLAKESQHDCKRAYAQTTRFELAEWKMHHQIEGAKMAVGIEDGYTGKRYILRRFSQDCPEVCIQGTLKDTCNEAIRLLRTKNHP